MELFISIDDNELYNLRLICDEIFGANHFVETIVWQKRTSADAKKKRSAGHEYVLIYCVSTAPDDGINLLPLDGKDVEVYKNPDNDPRGLWISSPFTAPGYRPNKMYSITTPGGKNVLPPKGRFWCSVEGIYSKRLLQKRGNTYVTHRQNIFNDGRPGISLHFIVEWIQSGEIFDTLIDRDSTFIAENLSTTACFAQTAERDFTAVLKAAVFDRTMTLEIP